MPIRTIQQKFTAGEIDPVLLGRSDLDYYYSSAERMKNVIVLPQGGFKTRPGLEFRDHVSNIVTRETSPTISAPNGGTGANANDLNTATSLVTTTNIGTNNPYIVVSYDLGSAKNIEYVDVVALALSANTSSDFDIEYSSNGSSWTVADDVPTLSTTAITKRFWLGVNARYVRLVRNGATSLTATVTLQEFNVFIDSGTLSNARLMPFNANNSQRYMLVFTDQNIAVYKNGVWQTDIRALPYTSAILPYINWTQSADTGIIVHESVQPYRLLRNSDTNWDFTPITFDYVPKYDFTTTITNPAFTLTPSGTDGTVKLTTSGAFWSSGSVNQYVTGNGGRARIVSFISTTVVSAVVEIPFYNTDVQASGSWNYETGYEDAWSAMRGWPKAVTFHQSRLWFGGTTSLPQTVWGSRIGLFFDFNPGALNSGDSLEATIQDDDVNAVINLYSQRTLQIFTTSAEYAIITGINEAVAPDNLNITRQTQRGSREGLRVYENDGQTLFVQAGGRTVLGYVYSDIEQAYTNDEISLLSSHLVKTPVDVALRKATATDESNLYMLVNSDGKLTTVTLLTKQNVVAFTEQETDGLFLNVGVDNDTTYFVVRRTLNGVTSNFLERFNSDMITDCGVYINTGLPTNTFSGLDHLDGEEVKIVADGAVMTRQTVASGSLTIERNAVSYFETGLVFIPYVKTIPAEVPQTGPMLGRKVRISEVVLRLHETVGVKVSLNSVSFRGFGPAGSGSPLNMPPPAFTGDKVISGIRGWSDRGQVELTQDTALPMTVLALSYVVGF